MGFSTSDVVPFTQASANLSELAARAKAGAEKIITKNGESYVALIDADRLDDYHRLERERIHLLLIDDARRGLADIVAGRTHEADAAIAQLQKRRAGSVASKARHRATATPAEPAAVCRSPGAACVAAIGGRQYAARVPARRLPDALCARQGAARRLPAVDSPSPATFF